MRIDLKTDENNGDRKVISRRGFLALAGAGIGLAGLRSLFCGTPMAAAQNHADERRKNNVSDVTARYWVGGDRLAG